MTVPVVIAGFPSSNRVPGAYGEVLTGQGGQSAASLPLACLVVGLPTTGSITPNTQIVPILSTVDADTYAGPGSEGACMLYDALQAAGQAGVPLFYCTATPAAGATAATAKLKITGTATGPGQVTVRVNGKPITQGIAIGDTGAIVCTNLAQLVSGNQGGRLPLSASASTNYCAIACRTPGQRGMQHVVFLDVSQLAPGLTAVLYTTWAATTTYAIGDQVVPKAAPNGLYFQATAITTGTTGSSEPTWPTTVGTTVVDGGVTWTCWGSVATGQAPTTAVFLGNGTGLETYTTLLGTLTSKAFDRIALAANDAVSLAAWKSQVDQYAGAPYNYLQHVVFGTNGTLSAAQSVNQTTCNDPRFQGMWEQNAETHPARIAAQFAAIRALSEQQNPNSAYDGMAFPTALVAPQSQPADWPNLAVLISAINNGVTPVCSSAGDGYSRVIRSITTKCLTGGNADYSTIDTGMMSTPDFVLKDGKLYYTTFLQPQNPVAMDDPPPGGPKVPSGVLTPSIMGAALNGRLVDFSKGIVSGTSPSIPPMVQPPQPGDVQPSWDPVGQRPMVAVNVRVMPIDHQVGISVRQMAA